MVQMIEAEEAICGREETKVHARLVPRGPLLPAIITAADADGRDLHLVTHPQRAKFIFSCVTLDPEGKTGPYYYGLVPVAEELRYYMLPRSEEALGRPADGSVRVSRAYMKLAEVCECGPDHQRLQLQKDWTALDVGASPGGWTQFLAAHCKHVVA
eukprot:UC1_evm1s1147